MKNCGPQQDPPHLCTRLLRAAACIQVNRCTCRYRSGSCRSSLGRRSRRCRPRTRSGLKDQIFLQISARSGREQFLQQTRGSVWIFTVNSDAPDGFLLSPSVHTNTPVTTATRASLDCLMFPSDREPFTSSDSDLQNFTDGAQKSEELCLSSLETDWV